MLEIRFIYDCFRCGAYCREKEMLVIFEKLVPMWVCRQCYNNAKNKKGVK